MGKASKKSEGTQRADTKSVKAAVKTAKALIRDSQRLRKKKRKKVTTNAIEATEAAEQALQEAIDSLQPIENATQGQLNTLNQRGEALQKAIEVKLGHTQKAIVWEYTESILVAVLIALFIRALFLEAFKIPTGSMIPTLQINDHIFVNKAAYGLRVPFAGKYLMQWDGPERGEVIVFEFPGKGPDKGKDYIKRVVATPGDTIKLKDNTLHLNGEPLKTEVDADVNPCRDRLAGQAEVGLFSGCQKPKLVPDRAQCSCVIQHETVGDRTYRTQHIVERGLCRSTPDWPAEQALRLDAQGEYFGHAAANPDWPVVVIPEGHVMVMGDNRDNSRDGRFWGLVPFDAIKGRAFVTWWATDWERMFRGVE